MFLNETNPPLDEALAHFGVLGMRWGHRKEQSRQEQYGEYDTYDVPPENYKKKHTGAKIAVGGLVVAGAIASALILKNNGGLPVYKVPKSPWAGKTFRPQNVGNPLWTVHPKSPKAARDFVDAGFGKNGVFNVTTMARGAKTVKDFDADVWDVPMRSITSGRR